MTESHALTQQPDSTPAPANPASAVEPDAAAKAAVIFDVLANGKGLDILAFDIAKNSGFADVLFIVTATSVRHAQGLADQVLAESSARGLGYLRMEGHAAGQWILQDMGDVIVNILLESTRELYRLEGLWSGCPVLYGQADTQ